MNTELATRTYIELCNDVKKSKTETDFNINKIKADYYGKAIYECCGLSVWGEMIRKADMEIGSEDYPTCCGIPIIFKF